METIKGILIFLLVLFIFAALISFVVNVKSMRDFVVKFLHFAGSLLGLWAVIGSSFRMVVNMNTWVWPGDVIEQVMYAFTAFIGFVSFFACLWEWSSIVAFSSLLGLMGSTSGLVGDAPKDARMI